MKRRAFAIILSLWGEKNKEQNETPQFFGFCLLQDEVLCGWNLFPRNTGTRRACGRKTGEMLRMLLSLLKAALAEQPVKREGGGSTLRAPVHDSPHYLGDVGAMQVVCL